MHDYLLDPDFGRRQFILGAAGVMLAGGPGRLLARSPMVSHDVRIASNQGIENSALQQLMVDRRFARRQSLDMHVIEGKTISAPMDMLSDGRADVCMISAFVGVLPAIEQGRELRLVGAAMLLPALALYTGKKGVMRVSEVAGCRIGIGGANGLLHILALALLRKKGVDPQTVTWVNCGSNAQVFEAVVAGKVDAGLSGIAGTSNPGAHVVPDGRLWRELPEYTYQPAYASEKALREKPEAIARCIAAYTQLYRYLSGAASRDAYIEARRRVGSETGSADGAAIWHFIRAEQPYALYPGLSPRRIEYLQRLNVEVGVQKTVMPFDRVVDLGPALAAARLLR
jgi:ABC-type nitrate/sulfonate/bicarbonate transport system substrate-binding protein